MAITLAKLCANTERTYGMKLLAGKTGLDNFVRWVHIVEDSEVPDFMHASQAHSGTYSSPPATGTHMRRCLSAADSTT